METDPSQIDLTLWLKRMSQGDAIAADQVAEAIYGQLRQIAQRRLSGEGRDHSLQPTLLVNEVFLRMMRSKQADWQDRSHFFATAAKMMRHIVIDHFRGRGADKRPPRSKQLQLDDVVVFDDSRTVEVLIVDQALAAFAEVDARAAKVVEMRFFAGMTIEQIAEIHGVDKRTILRDWNYAKAWLKKHIADPGVA